MSVKVVDNKLFIFNPSTGEDIGTIKSSSKNEIEDIIDIASKKHLIIIIPHFTHEHKMLIV